MLLELKKYPAKILLSPSQKINKIDENIKKLVRDMIETMYANKGCGLAAPQVGVGLKLAVVDESRGKELPLVLINPQITKFSKELLLIEEGCLSLPGIEIKVKRPRQIEVKAKDLADKVISFKAEDLLARIIQHEVDHLNGELIINKAGYFTRRKLIKKLKKTKSPIL